MFGCAWEGGKSEIKHSATHNVGLLQAAARDSAHCLQ